jgi:hypothetical protein
VVAVGLKPPSSEKDPADGFPGIRTITIAISVKAASDQKTMTAFP